MKNNQSIIQKIALICLLTQAVPAQAGIGDIWAFLKAFISRILHKKEEEKAPDHNPHYNPNHDAMGLNQNPAFNPNYVPGYDSMGYQIPPGYPAPNISQPQRQHYQRQH